MLANLIKLSYRIALPLPRLRLLRPTESPTIRDWQSIHVMASKKQPADQSSTVKPTKGQPASKKKSKANTGIDQSNQSTDEKQSLNHDGKQVEESKTAKKTKKKAKAGTSVDMQNQTSSASNTDKKPRPSKTSKDQTLKKEEKALKNQDLTPRNEDRSVKTQDLPARNEEQSLKQQGGSVKSNDEHANLDDRNQKKEDRSMKAETISETAIGDNQSHQKASQEDEDRSQTKQIKEADGQSLMPTATKRGDFNLPVREISKDDESLATEKRPFGLAEHDDGVKVREPMFEGLLEEEDSSGGRTKADKWSNNPKAWHRSAKHLK